MRFDERSIADPLIGSVHDPIYQGAGPLGIAGIPQPKPGAVTKAHGGVLFLDEIGELHPTQMNKLLKVLEDRKVFLESAYYNSYDTNIPRHIHEIFQRGLPADFRLVGATTRNPSEIPAAIRSRCLEIFFRALKPDEIMQIARNAAAKGGFSIAGKAIEVLGRYASNGRDAVNIIQLAGGLALTEGRTDIAVEDIEWVVNSGHYSPRPERKIHSTPRVGCVNGLAVYGPNIGTVMEIEAIAMPAARGKGIVTVTGIVDEEEMGSAGKTVRRKSTAKGSVDNVLTAIKKYLQMNPQLRYTPELSGGIPVDGPSAGIGMAAAVYSAITGQPVDNNAAMTGEVSILGMLKPVGGIPAKLEAAVQAGVKKVIIPKENWQDIFNSYPITIIPVERLEQVIEHVICIKEKDDVTGNSLEGAKLLSAAGK